MPPVDRNNPKRAKSSDSHYTLTEFQREFPDDATCLDWLWRERYSQDGHTALCPKCERDRRFHRVKSRASYSCDHCGYHIHPTAGTVFHRSSTSLQLWFYAIYLMSKTRCGVSAKQLERELGVNYKTAWRMAKRIRADLMDEEGDPLGGTVEVDETFIGGRRRGHRGHQHHKTPVVGMVERGGKVRAFVSHPLRADDILRELHVRVLPDSLVYTDESTLYAGVQSLGYTHRRIKHGARIYVEGDVHTNTVENFFGLVKNGIRGVYHSVSRRHLPTYVAEYEFRFNHRRDETPMFKTLLDRAAS
jgi:transposase